MAVEPGRSERRAATRSAVAETPWSPRAVLRPGHEVALLDVSRSGLLLAVQLPVRPGRRVELQLRSGDRKTTVSGRIVRCQLTALTPPTYEAAVAFDESL